MIKTVFNQKIITRVLEEEISLATGCTEPSAVGIAVALAFNAAIGNLNSDLEIRSRIDPKKIVRKVNKVIVKVDRNIFKNSVSVGIPNTDGKKGIHIAVAIALFSDPSFKLNLFNTFKKEMLPFANKLADRIKIEVEDHWTGKSDININAIVSA